MNEFYTWCVIAVIALVTTALRFLPFVIWGGGRKIPKLIERLGSTLPYAIMGMLVVYCLKDVSIADPGSFLPAAIACGVVCLLHIWKRNTLISIICGTVCYMVLTQFIF